MGTIPKIFRNMNNPKYLIIHHTGGTDLSAKTSTQHQAFSEINEYHFNKWAFRSSLGFYIGYHYFIDKYGKITQGRADIDEGAHCIGYNTASLGICLAGNFDRGVDLPTQAQIESLQKLLKEKQAQYNILIQNIVPHRKLAQKTCYGNSLNDLWAQSLLIKVLPPPTHEELQVIQVQVSSLQLLLQRLLVLLKLRQTFGKILGGKDVC